MDSTVGATPSQNDGELSQTMSGTAATPASAAAPSGRGRQRTTRACDRCKLKKMRCTGKLPCAHCTAVQAQCQYTAKYTRGKVPPLQSAPQEEQRQYLAEHGWTPGEIPPRPQSSGNSSLSSFGRTQFNAQAQAGSSHPYRQMPTNMQGHDPSSSESIFRRTQNSLNQNSARQQKMSILACGDPPLPEVDSSFLVLPPLEIAIDLVAKYFEVVATSTWFLHRLTVENWTRELQSSRGLAGDKSKRAIVFLIFAAAHEYRDDFSGSEDEDFSFRYFQVAERQLDTETGQIQLSSIQARVMQCFYLISRSRLNQCWSIFGTVSNLIYALGIQRKPKSERAASEDLIITECSKRTFWGAYTLDKYLSLALGRPQSFHDDDIDQELPLLINDEHLSSSNYMLTQDESSCTAKASVLQIKLAIILGNILRDLYGIRPQPLEIRLAHSDKHKTSLEDWLLEIGPFFEPSTPAPSLMFRRQRVGLELACAHTLIINHRPFLLENAPEGTSPELCAKTEDNVKECLKAAMIIAKIVDVLHQKDKYFNSSWFAHFCGYTAAVSLYVFVIKRQWQPAETWMTYFEAAEKCRTQIKIPSEKGSFAQKCSAVMNELRAEATASIQRTNGHPYPALAPRRPEGLQFQDEQYVGPSGTQPGSTRQTRPLAHSNTASYFGGDWEDRDFDQTAPGGGILGSMDWIQSPQGPSVVDRINRWGFSSLTGH